MRWSAAVLGPVLGQRPDVAAQPLLRLIDDPPAGRAAFRGGREASLVIGPDDEGDAERLARAVDEMLAAER